MKIAIVLVLTLLAVGLAIVGYRFALQDAMRMYPRSKKRPGDDSTRLLAEINRKIKKAESLTVAQGDNDTLQRASKVLAELKEQRRKLEGELRGQ